MGLTFVISLANPVFMQVFQVVFQIEREDKNQERSSARYCTIVIAGSEEDARRDATQLLALKKDDMDFSDGWIEDIKEIDKQNGLLSGIATQGELFILP